MTASSLLAASMSSVADFTCPSLFFLLVGDFFGTRA